MKPNNPFQADFSSPEIPLTKTLQLLLFGATTTKKIKKIVNMSITRSSSNASIDLSISSLEIIRENISVNKETCLVNCKNILFQIENEILKK